MTERNDISLTSVLLAGGPRPGQTAQLLETDTWALPIADDLSVAEGWLMTFQSGLAAAGIDRSIDMHLLAPNRVRDLPGTVCPRIISVQDARKHRGTAGAVADFLGETAFSDGRIGWTLVMEASASPAVRLDRLIQELPDSSDRELAVILGESALGRFCGCMLVRTDIYDLVPDVGFCDFKEQLLPQVCAAGLRMAAVEVADRAHRVNTREELLACVAACSGIRPVEHASTGFNRVGACAISSAADVGDATVVDSVIMEGASVGRGCVIARSVIGPNAVVKPGRTMVDVIHTADKRANGRNRAASSRSGPSS